MGQENSKNTKQHEYERQHKRRRSHSSGNPSLHSSQLGHGPYPKSTPENYIFRPHFRGRSVFIAHQEGMDYASEVEKGIEDSQMENVARHQVLHSVENMFEPEPPGSHSSGKSSSPHTVASSEGQENTMFSKLNTSEIELLEFGSRGTSKEPSISSQENWTFISMSARGDDKDPISHKGSQGRVSSHGASTKVTKEGGSRSPDPSHHQINEKIRSAQSIKENLTSNRKPVTDNEKGKGSALKNGGAKKVNEKGDKKKKKKDKREEIYEVHDVPKASVNEKFFFRLENETAESKQDDLEARMATSDLELLEMGQKASNGRLGSDSSDENYHFRNPLSDNRSSSKKSEHRDTIITDIPTTPEMPRNPHYVLSHPYNPHDKVPTSTETQNQGNWSMVNLYDPKQDKTDGVKSENQNWAFGNPAYIGAQGSENRNSERHIYDNVPIYENASFHQKDAESDKNSDSTRPRLPESMTTQQLEYAKRIDSEFLLIKAASVGDYGWAESLLKAGANPNVKYPMNKCTALHYASWQDYNNAANLIHILLSSGANPNVINYSGAMPLHDAIMHQQTNGIVMLINSGCNVNAFWPGGNTYPLNLAVQSGDPSIVHYLLQAGACIRHKSEVRTKGGKPTLTTMQEVMRKNNRINATNFSKILQLLVEADKDINKSFPKEADLWTLLHSVREVNQYTPLQLITSVVQMGYQPSEPEMQLIKDIDKSKYEWVKENIGGIPSLKDSCICTVRKSLRNNVIYGVERLSMPDYVKDQILLQQESTEL